MEKALKKAFRQSMTKIFFVFLSTIPLQANADTPYVGIDYMLTNIEFDSEKAEPDAIGLRVGASNNNMAFEAQYIRGNTDNIYRMGFDFKQSAALYFVLQSDLREGFGMDFSIGYAMTEIAVSGPEETYNGSDNYNGFSWVISMHQQIPFVEEANIRLAYQSLYHDSNLDITNISLGFTYNF